MKRIVSAGLLICGILGCRDRTAEVAESAGGNDSAQPAFEPPVMTNADSPVRYPPALFQKNIEGTVMLRLFVDSLGRLTPESTRVAESSGVPGLDSAARAAVATMTFAPARQNGRPVATSFLQPIEFRRPERPAATGEPER